MLAWHDALREEGIELLGLAHPSPHRHVGRPLRQHAAARDGLDISDGAHRPPAQSHADAYSKRSGKITPLPGARELLKYLTDTGIPWAIATSGRMETAGPVLATLGVDLKKTPVVTRDQVRFAKPDPDLFMEAADRLGVDITTSCVVGDAIWDMLAARRARSLGIGLLSGGYGEEELLRSGAYRVFADPAHMLYHIDEIGGRQV